MVCKCKYFLRDKQGILRCTQCGKAAHAPAEEVEDKIAERPEDKLATGHETKRRKPKEQ